MILETIFKCRRCSDKFGYRYIVKSRKFTQLEGWHTPERATAENDIQSVSVELYCMCGKPLVELSDVKAIKELVPHRRVTIIADVFYDNPNQLKIWETKNGR